MGFAREPRPIAKFLDGLLRGSLTHTLPIRLTSPSPRAGIDIQRERLAEGCRIGSHVVPNEPLIGGQSTIRHADLPLPRANVLSVLTAQTGGREAYRHSPLSKRQT